ncbi:MAG: hypothetical protein ACOC85_02945 [Thermoplasmatota archaeon]
MASYIMSLLFLLPAIILIYNNYIISHRLEGFERYFCNYCEDYFYAHKPRSKNKDDVHCSDCGTKLNTPENFIKGRKFEQKVKERFERSEGFKVVSETPRYEDKNTHAKKYPDLRVQFFNKDKFFVEVKYRSHLSSRNLADIITKDTQLKRFKDYKEDTGEEVYYFLGIGGKPEDPKEVFVIPVNHLIFHLKNNRDLDYLREKHYDIDLKRNAYYKIDKEKDRKILR